MIPSSGSVLHLRRDYEEALYYLAIEVIDHMLVTRLNVVVYAEQGRHRFFTIITNSLNRHNREDIKSVENETIVLKNGSRLNVRQYKDYNALSGDYILLVDLDNVPNGIIRKIVTDQFSRIALTPTMVLLGSDKKIGCENAICIFDAQSIQGLFKDTKEEEVS